MKTEVKRYKNLQYAVAVPDSFDPTRKYPCVLFLHGGGTRGTDADVLLGNSYFKNTAKLGYDAVTFAPQCHADTWFDLHEQLMDFAEFVSATDFVDSDRVYLMGPSMGGYATWQLAMSRPDLFAAIVPICGGGTYWNAARLCSMGVWAVHGDKDDAIFCEESVKMVNAIKANGGVANLTILEGVGHNSWDYVYSSLEIHDWMFSHSKNSRPDMTIEDKYLDPVIYG